MKLSKFNHFFEVDGRNYFYNTKSSAIAEVSEDFLTAIRAVREGNFKEENFSKELIDSMIYAGAIIKDDYDELMNLSYQNNSFKYSKDRLVITVIPTFECNCRCGYCYENKVKGVMSFKVKNGLLNLIKNQSSIKMLNVIWFGGEPLLYRNELYDLSDTLLKYCNENNISYSCSMVTNLTLLEEKDIAKLKEYKIYTYQVTLDGPEIIHNKRRPEIGEKNSFRKIVKNIKLLISNGLKVDLRINIDRSNIEYIPELLSFISADIGHHNNLSLYPARVGNSNSNVCRSAKLNCIDNADDWSDVLIDFYEQCVRLGFSKSIGERLIPKSSIMSCSAEFANYFAIDPEGYLYKCSLIAGQKVKAFQNVCDNHDLISTSSSNYLSWIVPSFTSFNKCNECKLLPICMGGCRLLYCNTQLKYPVCESSENELNKYLSAFIKFRSV